MRHLSLLFVCVFLCFSAKATHIVGGEINYRCLGNDQYEVELTVYRDCFNGVPYFDSPAAIGIFDSSNALVNTLFLDIMNDDTLELVLSSPCLSIPPNVCVHRTNYRDTVALPFLPGGYQLAYQRCCRNFTINNIVAPSSTGATYFSYVSEEALLGCNSSARFIAWPPPLICNNVPINFNHSAFDPDGDSVVYELCTPFEGAIPTASMPQPPNPPPYIEVSWQSPFDVNNMLGITDQLTIDPVTGIITGIPHILGQFVVGVCAKEYRNGVLISTTKRDFQYNVGDCLPLSQAAFNAPTVECDNGFSVTFNNVSQSISSTFFWDFGDPTTLNDTSSLQSPTYIYPDTGLYTIMLVSDPGFLCADTLFQTVSVQYESIFPEFDISTIACTDTLSVQITDQTIDTISTIVNWNWLTSDSQTSMDQNPVFNFTQSGTYIIGLQAFAQNGCLAFHVDTVEITLPVFEENDTVSICFGEPSVELNSGGDPTLDYSWTPVTGLSDPNIANPVASPATSTTYSVQITSFNTQDTCQATKSVTVLVQPDITITPMPDTSICASEIDLFAQSNAGSVFEWSTNADFSGSIGTGNPLTLMVDTSAIFYVTTDDGFGCKGDTASLQVTVIQDTVDVSFDATTLNCSDSLIIQFFDTTSDTLNSSIDSWTWTFGNGDSAFISAPIALFDSSGSYFINLEVLAQNGCKGSLEDTITLQLPDFSYADDTLVICEGESVALNPDFSANFTYFWLNGVANPLEANPTVSPTNTVTYEVEITSFNQLDTCVSIEKVTVKVADPLMLFVGTDSTLCADSLTLSASTNATATYKWYENAIGGPLINPGGDPNPIVTPNQPTQYWVEATDIYNCKDTNDIWIFARQVDLLSDSALLLCQNDTTLLEVLNSDPIDSLSYIWSPASEIESDPTLSSVLVSPQFNTTYQVLANNQFGCKDSVEFNVLVSNLTPPLSISASDNSIFEGQSTQLIATINSSYNYFWNNNPALSAFDVANPIATPLTTQTFYLYIEDEFGCNNQDSIEIEVRSFECDEDYVFLPNAFTPDGDGVNDVLYVRSGVVTDVRLTIYNRWGEKVFETNSLNDGWDGTYKGKELPPDVFGYYLEGTCLGGLDFLKKGNITLIR